MAVFRQMRDNIHTCVLPFLEKFALVLKIDRTEEREPEGYYFFPSSISGPRSFSSVSTDRHP